MRAGRRTGRIYRAILLRIPLLRLRTSPTSLDSARLRPHRRPTLTSMTSQQEALGRKKRTIHQDFSVRGINVSRESKALDSRGGMPITKATPATPDTNLITALQTRDSNKEGHAQRNSLDSTIPNSARTLQHSNFPLSLPSISSPNRTLFTRVSRHETLKVTHRVQLVSTITHLRFRCHVNFILSPRLTQSFLCRPSLRSGCTPRSQHLRPTPSPIFLLNRIAQFPFHHSSPIVVLRCSPSSRSTQLLTSSSPPQLVYRL